MQFDWNFDFLIDFEISEIIYIKQLQKFFARGVWNCAIPKRMFSIQGNCQNSFISKP
jgi:hypothetical protein